MATGQNHYTMHCLTFPVDQGKAKQAKIREIKTQIWRKQEKNHDKNMKMEQMIN